MPQASPDMTHHGIGKIKDTVGCTAFIEQLARKNKHGYSQQGKGIYSGEHP